MHHQWKYTLPFEFKTVMLLNVGMQFSKCANLVSALKTGVYPLNGTKHPSFKKKYQSINISTKGLILHQIAHLYKKINRQYNDIQMMENLPFFHKMKLVPVLVQLFSTVNAVELVHSTIWASNHSRCSTFITIIFWISALLIFGHCRYSNGCI